MRTETFVLCCSDCHSLIRAFCSFLPNLSFSTKIMFKILIRIQAGTMSRSPHMIWLVFVCYVNTESLLLYIIYAVIVIGAFLINFPS